MLDCFGLLLGSAGLRPLGLNDLRRIGRRKALLERFFEPVLDPLARLLLVGRFSCPLSVSGRARLSTHVSNLSCDAFSRADRPRTGKRSPGRRPRSWSRRPPPDVRRARAPVPCQADRGSVAARASPRNGDRRPCSSALLKRYASHKEGNARARSPVPQSQGLATECPACPDEGHRSPARNVISGGALSAGRYGWSRPSGRQGIASVERNRTPP